MFHLHLVTLFNYQRLSDPFQIFWLFKRNCRFSLPRYNEDWITTHPLLLTPSTSLTSTIYKRQTWLISFCDVGEGLSVSSNWNYSSNTLTVFYMKIVCHNNMVMFSLICFDVLCYVLLLITSFKSIVYFNISIFQYPNHFELGSTLLKSMVHKLWYKYSCWYSESHLWYSE